MVFASDLPEIVFKTVSLANELTEAVDKVLAREGDSVLMPRQALEMINSALKANSELAKHLFEENQTIMDSVDDFLRKNPPEEGDEKDGSGNEQHDNGNPDS